MNTFRQSCHAANLAVPPTVDENPLITTAEDRELYDEVFRLYFADPQHFGQTMRICKTTSRPELARIRIWLVEKTPGLDDPEFEYKAGIRFAQRLQGTKRPRLQEKLPHWGYTCHSGLPGTAVLSDG